MLCKWCKTPISTTDIRRKAYCSHSCREKAKSEEAEKLRAKKAARLSTGKRGAISELRVCVDLMEKHYEVFRAVSPACSCDIAILKNGKFLRVECKTGVSKESYSGGRKIRADVLAVVLPDKIVYKPDISIQRFPREISLK